MSKSVMVGKYQSGHATCVLQKPMSVPIGMRNGLRELTKLHTPLEHRKKGDASQLLNDVCEEADRQGLVLMLMPEPFGEPDLGSSQLEAWYSRFGFITIQEHPKLMARMVGSTPRTLNPVTAAVGRAIEAM